MLETRELVKIYKPKKGGMVFMKLMQGEIIGNGIMLNLFLMC